MMFTCLRDAALLAAWIATIGISLAAPASAQAPSGDLAARMKDPAQWPMAARDYANTRFSELDQINGWNVSQHQPACTSAVGADGGQEQARPLVDGPTF